ncbi:Rrf2 family transcriptional regulator [Virgibacillus sp. 179-BFC.A HS]|uniref:Rrf2 family transcriptional regulator n=1 Tax=Tigheibacillus jepli TaxID=3035914 RepID=A0ABU5CKS4_9BACI|nr:Rrf2 family transcriptional regulator [Virgibacillus sp. 179-BFC.A HS]MDY0406921.1 Rrf2 family transcriptional regulator [Virgibacillus sp. 179-BFC.A HS]
MQLLIQSGDLGPKWFHVALRSIVLMAESKIILKSHHIAESIGEDPTFVRKILVKLAKVNIVQSHGGRYGGYSLEMDPSNVTVKDIYNALGTSPPTPYWSVSSTGAEYFISLIISKAEEEFQSVLERYTIEDILKHKKTLGGMKE